MSIFKKLDVIPSPYSTILALLFSTILAVYCILMSVNSLGVGILIGSYVAIILKKCAEVSDKQVLEWICKILLKKKWLSVLIVVLILLAVGHIRLPMAALSDLADYDILANSTTIYAKPSKLKVSNIQQWWIKTRMGNVSKGDSAPRIHVETKWYMLFCARVNTGHYISSTGAESKDTLYLWFFGAWIPIYNFGHLMA